jgi:hypothetical protein
MKEGTNFKQIAALYGKINDTQCCVAFSHTVNQKHVLLTCCKHCSTPILMQFLACAPVLWVH